MLFHSSFLNVLMREPQNEKLTAFDEETPTCSTQRDSCTRKAASCDTASLPCGSNGISESGKPKRVRLILFSQYYSGKGLWLLRQGQQPINQRHCRGWQRFVGQAYGGPLPSVFYRKPIFKRVSGPAIRSGRLTDLAELSLFLQSLPRLGFLRRQRVRVNVRLQANPRKSANPFEMNPHSG